MDDSFSHLSWNDLNEWAGSKIVARGRSYQQQGLVTELAQAEDGSLLAWVNGSDLYATRVQTDGAGRPVSSCSCPYGPDCKHGVAVLLEYLEMVKNNEPVSAVATGDERLELLTGDSKTGDVEAGEIEATLSRSSREAIDVFLGGRSKKQLLELIYEIAGQHPEIAQDLADRQKIKSGNIDDLVTRLRQEIHDIASEPGWQDYWRGEGYAPDYSEIRNKLEVLLNAGHAGEVLDLGKELVNTGIRLVEESHDQGETAGEVAGCMPVIAKALKQSSLDAAGKLIWALEAALIDDYDICEVFVRYLHKRHSSSAWSVVADWLLDRLSVSGKANGDVNSGGDSARGHANAARGHTAAGLPGLEADSEDHVEVADYLSRYRRDRLSDWIIYALEQSGRQDEIIPLCEAEARRTGSYLRLVERLMAERRHGDAEVWIEKGIRATSENLPGIAADLRLKLREIRVMDKNWPAVAALLAEEFVRRPSREAFAACRKGTEKVKLWPQVRQKMLGYLEKGRLPWKQPGWPLPENCMDTPEAASRERFPMLDELIDIAILEKQPDRVLHWYDQYGEIAKNRLFWPRISEDEIAVAVQSHAPDRAVAIWKNLAEQLIATVNTGAYQKAAGYLRKAGRVMARQKKKKEWEEYLQDLREKHARKRRLMEIMEELNGEPIAGRGAANA